MKYWATVGDAAHLSGVPARTIRRWVTEGRLTTRGERRPQLVELGEVEELRDMLRNRTARDRSAVLR